MTLVLGAGLGAAERDWGGGVGSHEILFLKMVARVMMLTLLDQRFYIGVDTYFIKH